MKVRRLSTGTYVLEHDSYSPAMFQAARAIPGCIKNDSKSIRGSSDAIEAAVKYLIEERGLNASAFEGLELLEALKWGEHASGS